MAQLRTTVENIKRLIQSGDLSDTPELRRLHGELLELHAALDAGLEKCRVLIAEEAFKEARGLSDSFAPPLTEQAELLLFPGWEEFFAVCREYGLDSPKRPDPALLNRLSAPVTGGDKHLHALLQDYRRIARSGSLQERIELLRKIVKKLPDSRRWHNDLAAAEHAWFQEMEQSLNHLPPGDEGLALLERFCREVLSPDLTAPVKPELEERIRKLLLPRQQEKIRRGIEERLGKLTELLAARDLPRLRAAFDEWQSFCANPQVRLGEAERSSAEEVENFLRVREEEQARERRFSELVGRLEQKIVENRPFSEIAGDYNQLLLQDLPVPPSLQARVENLEQENRRHEKLLSARRSVYFLAAAAVVIIGLFLAGKWTRYFLTVRTASADMEQLIAAGKYGEAAALYEKLRRTDPEPASNASLLKKYNEASARQKEQQAQNKARAQEFARLVGQIKILLDEKDVLDVSEALDRNFADARKIMAGQPREMLDAFRKLETAVAKRRTELKQKREKEFLDASSAVVGELNKLAGAIDERDLPAAERAAEMLRNRFDAKVQQFIYVPAALKNREIKRVADARANFDAALKKAQALHDLKFPRDFLSYVQTLESIRYQEPALAMEYAQALLALPRWKVEFDNSRTVLPTSAESLVRTDDLPGGLLKQDFDRILMNPARSPKFAKFFASVRQMDQYKELFFTDDSGCKYFFYTTGKITVERLRRPRRVNISFNSVENNGYFLFTFLYDAKKTPFRTREFPKGLSYRLPEGFAALWNSPVMEGNPVFRPWPGAGLAEQFKGLNADGPGVARLLIDALKWIAAPGNVPNVCLREMLMRNFLDALCFASPLFSEATEALIELEAFNARGKYNWREPQAAAKSAEMQARLEELLAKADPERLGAAGKLRADFVFAFHARRFVPAGVIHRAPDGKSLELHIFRPTKPVEMLLLTDDGVSLLPDGAARKGARFAPVPGRLFPGQLVWTFDDDRKSADFVREWEQKALRLNTQLKIRPLLCPAETAIQGQPEK
ncbi:MAG: hypothetical protein IJT50_04430 [Lentisphaeria bacterium]|nr:hypothetical protein [Lentisphaeria bacterium]